jgi:hypothetical protein
MICLEAMLRTVAEGRARKAQQRFMASLADALSRMNSYTMELHWTTSA